ncbi:MAG TPA: long-chain fatty acid--CoA ligase [Solirubrobacteraceae bacterium]|nr:long-chain fatty acid--CoA ligase [Solirubrobacteraceae bacterium]
MATSTGLRPVAERITGAATLGRMVLSASERGDDVALRVPVKDGFRSITYRQFGRHAREIARGLIALGIEVGDVVAILSSTRAEWTLCEAGALCTGAVIAPVYHTNSPEECRHVLSHSGARAVICEDAEQAAKVELVRARCTHLEHVVVIDGEAPHASSLAELRRGGQDVAPEEVEARVRAVEPGDLATLVYTSGTTGPPKGCALTHANFLAATAMYRGALELDDVQPVIYMFLPLAHVLARLAQTVVLDVGGTLVYWSGDPAKILGEVAQSQPTHFVAVPRIYEKLHTGVISAVESRGWPARALFAWALEVGRRSRKAQRAGSSASPLSALRLRMADQVGLAKVRALFGGNLTMALVGAAPIDHELLEFFDACGVLVLEGYGMTESCATATLNPANAPRFGTVGRALPDSEVMVNEGGEVLLRGPHVFAGYHRDAKATAATFAEGWLRTGDLGTLSPDGYLTLTGRSKELIITAGGKNITPVNIESALRETRWIAEAVVYGDGRPYLVCMVTLDPDEAPKLAEQLEIPAELASMASDERVHEALQADVDAANARFARVEQVKRFGILDHELTQAAGELTPTLKVKRSLVYERYADFFGELYAKPRRGLQRDPQRRSA